jgi:hypothetical protein
VDKKMFAQNIYNVSSEDLGRVVQFLDQRCEVAIKKIDAEDLEIDIDAIDAATFWAADAMVRDHLPGGTRKAGGGGGGGGGGGVKKAGAPVAAPSVPAVVKAAGGAGGAAGGMPKKARVA